MRWYLRLYTGVQYAGTTLRDKVSVLPKIGSRLEPAKPWDVSNLTRECSRVAGERALDKRLTALSNRLLVEAEEQKFPLPLLTPPVESATKLDWRRRYDVGLTEALQAAEQVWVRPTGTRRLLQTILVTLGNTLPTVALLGGYLIVMYAFFVNGHVPGTVELLSPVILTLILLVILQLLINLLLPMRWSSIRGEFRRQLEERLRGSLREAFLAIPGEVAQALERERRQVEELRGEVGRVRQWLEERQQQANIAGLYGSEQS